MPLNETSHHIKDIKKTISSIEPPMVELPFETIRNVDVKRKIEVL